MDAFGGFGMPRLYTDLAWLFPIVTPKENYIEEAAQFTLLIHRYTRLPAYNLLNFGCGAGHNDHYLQEAFTVTGVDLSAVMLDMARQLNPQANYWLGDIRTIDLGQSFEAVVLADSITYLLNETDLQATFANAFRHLKPGGVFVTYLEETLERFEQNNTYTSSHHAGEIEVALVENYYDPDPSDTHFEMTFIYLIRRAGQLQVEVDRHRAGLFPEVVYEQVLRDTGFEVFREPFRGEEFGFLIGVKPV